MDWVIIGQGEALAPLRRQVITLTVADLLPIGPIGINLKENETKKYGDNRSRKKSPMQRGNFISVSMGTFEISHKILNPYTAKYAFYCFQFLRVSYDIFELWRHKP